LGGLGGSALKREVVKGALPGKRFGAGTPEGL
jgi:hypothetical protein